MRSRITEQKLSNWAALSLSRRTVAGFLSLPMSREAPGSESSTRFPPESGALSTSRPSPRAGTWSIASGLTGVATTSLRLFNTFGWAPPMGAGGGGGCSAHPAAKMAAVNSAAVKRRFRFADLGFLVSFLTGGVGRIQSRECPTGNLVVGDERVEKFLAEGTL